MMKACIFQQSSAEARSHRGEAPPQPVAAVDDRHQIRLAIANRSTKESGGNRPPLQAWLLRAPCLFVASLVALSFACFASDPPLFVPAPLTVAGGFIPDIEGPACDAAGNIYFVNGAWLQTIERTTGKGASEVLVTLPGNSVGNGIRVAPDGLLYVADYTAHNVLQVDTKTRVVKTFAHEERMNQPNDLALAPDGTLYASDPNWEESTGSIWSIDRNGRVRRLAENMGTTNGIEVSPDGHTLYVNESVQRNVWAFTIAADGSLTDQRLLIQFADFSLDGMRCDVDGDLYITRQDKGTVVKLSPAGQVLREFDVLGSNPSNLCFGGPDGCTLYVTEVQHQRLVQVRVDRPGLEWQRLHEK